MENQPMAEMPKYECHKKVHALKIKKIERAVKDTEVGAILSFAENGYADKGVDSSFVEKINNRENRGDKDLGYYVVYEDGYVSWSPTEAFEKGYTRI